MLSKLGENYPYKRDRSAPGLIRQQKNEPRNYNIITCLEKAPATKVPLNNESLPQIQMPKQRKLGEYKDFPYPKNKKDCESRINFNLAKTKSELGNESAAQSEFATSKQFNPNYSAKNLMNSSSVAYNFVTNTIIDQPKTIKDLRNESQLICNRTKQIGAIYDQGRLFAPNFNPEYQSFFKTNLTSYHRNKGMCADTYNRAHTYGPGLKPFRKFK